MTTPRPRNTPLRGQSVRSMRSRRAKRGNGCEYFRTVTEVGGTPGVGAFASPIARSSVARVGTATAVTAVCGYAVVYLAARDLAPAGFSVFAVFWGAFGLVTGAANGLLQETTREIPRPATRRCCQDGAPTRCGSRAWSGSAPQP